MAQGGMTIGSLSFGTDVSSIMRESASAANPFYETTASPNSLASIVRNHIVVRDAHEPISFPFGVEEIVGFDRSSR